MGLIGLRCRACGAEYDAEARYVCTRCFGPVEAAYDHSALAGDPAALRRRIEAGPQSLWRYADLLPVDAAPAVAADSLPTGGTPLVRADRLARRLGLGEVWVKNDTANPTHSFKDRVVAVACAKAQELGLETL